jgi:hypothetical protein
VFGLLESLGERLADRWIRILLPGTVFLAVVICGILLGPAHAWDGAYLADAMDRIVGRYDWRASVLAVVVAGVIAAATLAGLASHALSGLVHAIFTARRPGAWVRLRRRRAAKRARWRTLDRYLPARVTPIGDRFQHIAERVDAQYGVDAGVVWPRLWLLLPDRALARIQNAHDQYQFATITCGWGILHLALGVWWWPAAVMGVVLLAAGYRRAKTTAGAVADLIEASIDTHQRELAQSVGVDLRYGRITPSEGAQINAILGKIP